jgi:hypothetical protein
MHLLWNNVIKIGKEGEKGAPPQVILDWQEKWFDVVRFEITELRPDIVVFFSGWKRDCYITKALRSATFEALNQWSIKELARVTASGILPEGRTIRAEHPTPLYHQGRAYFNEYMAEIVAAIQI